MLGHSGNEAGVVPALVEPQPSGEDRTQMGQQPQERREWAGGSTLQTQMGQQHQERREWAGGSTLQTQMDVGLT